MTIPPGREALLRAAIKVVGDQGMSRLTYRGLAQEAGVSHGLIRHHFGTKEQLIEEALEYAIQQNLEQTGVFAVSPHEGSLAPALGFTLDGIILRQITLGVDCETTETLNYLRNRALGLE